MNGVQLKAVGSAIITTELLQAGFQTHFPLLQWAWRVGRISEVSDSVFYKRRCCDSFETSEGFRTMHHYIFSSLLLRVKWSILTDVLTILSTKLFVNGVDEEVKV